MARLDDRESGGVIATLPMYDRPELRRATDRLWGFVARALEETGVGRPERLGRCRRHEVDWADERLLFSQACGYDVRFRFRGRLIPIGVPVYRAAGCEGIHYRSAIVTRSEDEAVGIADLRGRRAAINEPTSHSGRVALAAMVAEQAVEGRFFAGTLITGSHEASAEAVAEGRADVAALDCTSFALMRLARPELGRRLRVLAESPPCPAPPFVVGPASSASARAAICEALAAVEHARELADVRDGLLLEAIRPVEDPGIYDACGALVDRAARFGYDLLADRDDAGDARR